MIIIKRGNPTEQSVADTITRVTPNLSVFPKNNSLKVMEIRAKYIIGNALFLDAESPLYTEKGNPKKTEFVLCINGYWIRIECKSQKTNSVLIESIQFQFSYIPFMPENEYWLVVNGYLATDYCMNLFEKEKQRYQLQNKVWIGTLNDFEVKLKTIIF